MGFTSFETTWQIFGDLDKNLQLHVNYRKTVCQFFKESFSHLLDSISVWFQKMCTMSQVCNDKNPERLKASAGTLMLEHHIKETSLQFTCMSWQIEALKASLQDVEMRYSMELERYNGIIMRLQEELTKIRNEIQQSGREYELLLNIKVKLEAEIAEYRRLLEGGGELKWVWGATKYMSMFPCLVCSVYLSEKCLCLTGYLLSFH